MLQAAVHSMYSRAGNGADVEPAPGRRSASPSGSLSGQSPQNAEPPPLRSSRRAGGRAGPHGADRFAPGVAEHPLAVRVGAPADQSPVAQQHEGGPGPRTGVAGREVVQGHGGGIIRCGLPRRSGLSPLVRDHRRWRATVLPVLNGRRRPPTMADAVVEVPQIRRSAKSVRQPW